MFSTNWLRGSLIAKQDPDQTSKQAAVLFSLWAQGHLQRSAVSSAIIVPFSALIGSLVWLFYLPRDFLRYAPEVVLSGIFTALFIQAIGDAWFVNIGAVFVLTFFLLIKEKILRLVRSILFDIGDFISIGLLSRRYINQYLVLGPLTTHDDADGLREHLFASRPVPSGTYDKELESFQYFSSSNVNDWENLRQTIDNYWRSFPDEPDFWQSLCAQQQDMETEACQTRYMRE